MLAKTVGVSQLIYAASLLTVLKAEIQKTQAELFAFLWKNKKDKIKRQVIVTKRDRRSKKLILQLTTNVIYVLRQTVYCIHFWNVIGNY